MKNNLRNIKYHPDLLEIDLPYIESKLGHILFKTFSENFDKEINLLHKEPVKNTARLKKPRLSEFGYRKVKFHWKKFKQEEKPRKCSRLQQRKKEKENSCDKTLDFFTYKISTSTTR